MGRPTDWGEREKHPMYDTWHHHRRKAKNGMVPEWKDDFWRFVKEIGEKPSPKHRLRKHRGNEPLGPDNFFWSETYFDGDRAKYQKEYRQRRPERVKNTRLKGQFGITMEEYTRMLNRQNKVCAICGGLQKNGLALCVDHDHKTGKVRGLLCDSCNRGIGFLKDDVSVLLRAVRYLGGA